MTMAVGHVNGRYGRNLNIACAVWMRIWQRTGYGQDTTGYDGLRLAGHKMQQQEDCEEEEEQVEEVLSFYGAPHVTADILSIKLCAKQG